MLLHVLKQSLLLTIKSASTRSSLLWIYSVPHSSGMSYSKAKDGSSIIKTLTAFVTFHTVILLAFTLHCNNLFQCQFFLTGVWASKDGKLDRDSAAPVLPPCVYVSWLSGYTCTWWWDRLVEDLGEQYKLILAFIITSFSLTFLPLATNGSFFLHIDIRLWNT